LCRKCAGEHCCYNGKHYGFIYFLHNCKNKN
jgi:hypothetical protein